MENLLIKASKQIHISFNSYSYSLSPSSQLVMKKLINNKKGQAILQQILVIWELLKKRKKYGETIINNITFKLTNVLDVETTLDLLEFKDAPENKVTLTISRKPTGEEPDYTKSIVFTKTNWKKLTKDIENNIENKINPRNTTLWWWLFAACSVTGIFILIYKKFLKPKKAKLI